MKRTENKETIIQSVDAILTADWHLRETVPVCRKDDFIQAQWNKVKFIAELQRKYNCPVIHSGDLFHHWKPSPELLSQTIRELPKKFYTVYGNHDLPQHNMELFFKSGVNTLKEAGVLTAIQIGSWGFDPKKERFSVEKGFLSSITIRGRKIFVWHVFTYTGGTPWPGCMASHAQRLIDDMPYDLIVTGDNHKPFVVYSDDGRILVNPGSLMRQAADQIDYKPRVYLYDAGQQLVEPLFLPINEDAVSREYLDIQEERDGRIDAFISRLSLEFDAGLSFEDNLERFFEKNNVRTSVRDIIYKSIK